MAHGPRCGHHLVASSYSVREWAAERALPTASRGPSVKSRCEFGMSILFPTDTVARCPNPIVMVKNNEVGVDVVSE